MRIELTAVKILLVLGMMPVADIDTCYAYISLELEQVLYSKEEHTADL